MVTRMLRAPPRRALRALSRAGGLALAGAALLACGPASGPASDPVNGASAPPAAVPEGEADAAPEPARPPIVLIVADDLGYHDLGVTGGRDVATPGIDAIAREGAVFTDGYSTQAHCAPSRASILTGRYPGRSGYVHRTNSYVEQIERNIGLPLTETLVAARLREAGYATGAVGKWHLGANPPYRPLARGFDEFFGFLGGGHDHLVWDDRFNGPIYEGDEPVEGEGFLTEAFTARAVRFVHEHADEPFFLYLAYNVIHSPLVIPDAWTASFDETTDDPPRRVALGMIAALDAGVVAVREALREEGLLDEALIVFVNDNGGAPRVTSNAPFREGKWRLYEGGIRVPFFLRWPGRVRPGSEFRAPVSTLDIVPTLLAAAGVEPGADWLPFDGVDLLPWLAGERDDPPHAILFWEHEHIRAARRGDWKAYWTGPVGEPVKHELYDLSADPGERTDLAGEHPEVLEELRSAHLAWQREMVPPTH